MKHVLLAAIFASLPVVANALDTNFRSLIMEAMQSKTGSTTAELTGPLADIIRGRINRPNAKILAEVTTLEKLPQEGCKRFQIRFTTPGTLLPTEDGRQQMLDLNMKLNMCPNGMPPGVDAK